MSGELGELSTWFLQTLWLDILPLWSTVGLDARHGGYEEVLCETGKASPCARRVRVSARQVYAFSEAERLGWNRFAARDRIDHGLRFLLAHLSSDGFLQHTLTPDDTVLDAGADLYDQAFLLLALAHADRFAPEEALEERAMRLVGALRVRFGYRGGFIDREDRPFPLRANPHMHLLEAGLAWVEMSGDPFWDDLCSEIADLFLTRLVDPETGVLLEEFTDDWRPIRVGGRFVVEPGHNYEWAWLLQRWERLCGGDAQGFPERLVSFAESSGYDARRHVALNAVGSDGIHVDASARLWPQTERMKAWLSIGDRLGDEGRLEAEAKVVDAGNALRRYFDGMPPGMWRDVLQSDGTFLAGTVPASSLYHVICAVAELVRYVQRSQPMPYRKAVDAA